MKIKILLVLSLITSSLFSQNLYDVNTITQLELSFFDANWDDSLTYYKVNSLENRMFANCVINGIAFDSVGVKYKGNSTFDPNWVKKPLNIKLNYIKDQDYQGFYTLKMSNGKNEPSFLREVVGYEIARKYMDASLCNYVQVYADGNYHGLYESAESVNKKFIAQKFYSDSDNAFFKCDPISFGAPPQPGCANSFNASFLYLGQDSLCYDGPYEIKSDYGFEALRLLTLNIQDNPSTIENHLDMDRLIWMMAYNNVLVNLDSYLGRPHHNYYVFKDDNQRWDFILWDINGCFGGFRMLYGGPNGSVTNTQMQTLEPFEKHGDSNSPLLNLVFDNPTYKRMYMAHFRTIFEENIENGLYFDRGLYFQNLISNAYQEDQNAFFLYNFFIDNLYTTVAAGNKVGIQELMEGRKTFLQNHSEVQKTPPTILNINTPEFANPNSLITITAVIDNPIDAYLAYRHSIALPFTKIQLYDDGMHNDEAANDGIYGATFMSASSGIQYYIYAENIDAGIFSPVRAEHEFYTIALTNDLVINEFCALNNTTEADQDGEYDDWIELYNNTSAPISLDGYYLSDDANDLSKWAFPTGNIINGNDFFMVWADNDDSQDGIHATFKLSSSGETLYLVDANLNIVDEITFGVQTEDITFGRYPNGIGIFTFMESSYRANNTSTTSNNTEVRENDNAVLLYPNPASNNIKIEFSNNLKPKQLNIYDLTGKLVLSSMVTSKQIISISDLTNGIYVVETGQNNFKKLVINR